MQRKDVVELIRVDMPDHTDGAFDVRIESDDGGNHIVIYIEDHRDSNKILSSFTERFKGHRILLMLVPKDFLH